MVVEGSFLFARPIKLEWIVVNSRRRQAAVTKLLTLSLGVYLGIYGCFDVIFVVESGTDTDARCTFGFWTSDLVHYAEICMICDGSLAGKFGWGRKVRSRDVPASTLYNYCPFS